MVESRYQEYKLNIIGPGVFDLTNWLSTNSGWVFSSVAQTTAFEGYAIGYCPNADPRSFEGIGISDGTVIWEIEPIDDR